MTKFRICVLIIVFLACLPVAVADADDAHLLFSASVPQPGIWSIRITGGLEDNTECLLMVADLKNEFLVAVVDPDADEQLINNVIALNPAYLDFCKLSNLNLRVELPREPSAVNRISFHKASLNKCDLIITEIVGVYSNAFDRIEFGIEAGTDTSGCMTMGRCEGGRPFWGPTCDPCEFTVCCYGSIGFIQCGEILCP